MSTTFAIWHELCEREKTPFATLVISKSYALLKGHILQLVRYEPDGSLCTASAEQIFPRDRVQRNCFEFIVSSSPYTPLAIMTASPIASVRVFETVRDADLATFGALPTSSMIDRAIIMLNDHRFWGHVSGPSSSGKTLPSFHPLLARPCRSALPRERFRSLALFGLADPSDERRLSGEKRK